MTKISESKKKSLVRQAKIALARKRFWVFCTLVCPETYNDEHIHLKDWCDRYQMWWETGDKTFLVFNAPPQHGKSLTAQLFSAWLLGKNPKNRIMVLCYSHKLSKRFSRNVRAFITAKHLSANEDTILYCDIFPNSKLKQGEGEAGEWSVVGCITTSFFSVSLDSAKTGFACDLLIIDDVVDGKKEALNEELLRARWDEIKNTILISRLVGGSRCVCSSTRWSKYDISGQLSDEYKEDIDVYESKALRDDGTMLCPAFLSFDDFMSRKKHGNKDIFLANFQQELIDQEGKLYERFKVWTPDMLPLKDNQGRLYTYKTECLIDVADRGSDFYCAIFYYPLKDGRIFIKDVIYTDKPLKETQGLTVEAIRRNETILCIGEGNNGGSIYIENLRRDFFQKYGTSCVFKFFNQTSNKENRILNQAVWCNEYIYMPAGWEHNFVEFYIALTRFQKIFKDNKHDDAADCLTMIADKFNSPVKKGGFRVRST